MDHKYFNIMLKNLSFLFFFVFSFSLKAKSQSNAISFNGTSEYAQIINADPLNLSNDFTIEAWVQLNKTDGNNFIISKEWCGNSQFAYALSIVDGKIRWAWNADGNCNYTSYVETSNVVFNASECHHLAVTHNHSNVKIYVDGIQVASNLIQGSYSYVAASSEPFRIGIYKGLSGTFAYFMNGKIDELRVWNSLRSQTQINQNKNNVLNGNEIDLIVYFDFENVLSGSYVTIPNKAQATGSLLNAETSANGQFQTSCAILNNLNVFDSELETNEKYYSIYPNPANSLITIELNKEVFNETITVFNVNGQKVKESIINGNKADIDIINFEKGFYFIMIGKTNELIKFIKN